MRTPLRYLPCLVLCVVVAITNVGAQTSRAGAGLPQSTSPYDPTPAPSSMLIVGGGLLLLGGILRRRLRT